MCGFNCIIVKQSSRTTNTNTWDLSSAGRASALQAEGHRFEPCRSHIYRIWRNSSVGESTWFIPMVSGVQIPLPLLIICVTPMIMVQSPFLWASIFIINFFTISSIFPELTILRIIFSTALIDNSFF